MASLLLKPLLLQLPFYTYGYGPFLFHLISSACQRSLSSPCLSNCSGGTESLESPSTSLCPSTTSTLSSHDLPLSCSIPYTLSTRWGTWSFGIQGEPSPWHRWFCEGSQSSWSKCPKASLSGLWVVVCGVSSRVWGGIWTPIMTQTLYDAQSWWFLIISRGGRYRHWLLCRSLGLRGR